MQPHRPSVHRSASLLSVTGVSLRIFLLLTGLLLAEIWSIPATASGVNCGPWGLTWGSEAIGRGLTPKDDDRYWERPCRDKQCRAARDLACAYDALLRRDVPNSMGRGGPASYDRDLKIYNATIRSLGRVHPDRIPLYCSLLAKVAALDTDRPDQGAATTFWTTELATRITRPNFDCIGQVMAAFPRTEPMAEVIASTKERCEIERYPLCGRIVQPPTSAAPRPAP